MHHAEAAHACSMDASSKCIVHSLLQLRASVVQAATRPPPLHPCSQYSESECRYEDLVQVNISGVHQLMIPNTSEW